ncbi:MULTISPECIES: hypothetical protein [Peribacillus]|nr:MULTISPECIES: hypothetical protein [unclassified Peribacillus]MCK1984515.1 hypothetical protein [Peribacillus sp. Aquil_B1]MCK2010240.1 hypothetical protein [Peribacillus sp. Aquil_B8]
MKSFVYKSVPWNIALKQYDSNLQYLPAFVPIAIREAGGTKQENAIHKAG